MTLKLSVLFVVPKSEASFLEEGSLVMNPDDNLGGLFVPSNRRMTRKGSRKGRKSAQVRTQLQVHNYKQIHIDYWKYLVR